MQEELVGLVLRNVLDGRPCLTSVIRPQDVPYYIMNKDDVRVFEIKWRRSWSFVEFDRGDSWSVFLGESRSGEEEGL